MIEENRTSSSFKGTSLEFQVLGDRFIEICRSKGLEEDDMRAVDEIYNEWMTALGNFDKKAKIVISKVGTNPRRPVILESIL